MIGSGVVLLPATLAPYGWNAVFGWLVSIGGSVMLALSIAYLASKVHGNGGLIGMLVDVRALRKTRLIPIGVRPVRGHRPRMERMGRLLDRHGDAGGRCNKLPQRMVALPRRASRTGG